MPGFQEHTDSVKVLPFVKTSFMLSVRGSEASFAFVVGGYEHFMRVALTHLLFGGQRSLCARMFITL